MEAAVTAAALSDSSEALLEQNPSDNISGSIVFDTLPEVAESEPIHTDFCFHVVIKAKDATGSTTEKTDQ